MKLVDKVGTPAPGHAPAAIVRDRPTVLLYATLGLLGYWLNGLGSVLGQLQRQLQVDRGSVAFYPSMFAVALIAVGLLAGRAAERVGHRVVLAAGLAAMTAGALLLATPWQPLTLLGAVLLGVGCALLVQVVPSAVTERHPADPAVVLGEANAVSSWASVLAPAAVALAVA
ncbi:MAG TPA: MFS transporter, partial [Frankiaceae bacterium]|nr:MFS transporter [Frankiaceae bacterium]